MLFVLLGFNGAGLTSLFKSGVSTSSSPTLHKRIFQEMINRNDNSCEIKRTNFE